MSLGFGATASPAAAAPAFGGFGAASPAAAAPAAVPVFGGGFGAAAAPPANTVYNAGAGFNAGNLPTTDTCFKDLSSEQKNNLNDIVKAYKYPTKIELDKIASNDDSKHVDLKCMLAEVKVLAMRLENKQKEHLTRAKALHKEVHEATLDCRRFGREEMHRIENRQDLRSRDNNLPNEYFKRVLSKLQGRMYSVNALTSHLDRVMASVTKERQSRALRAGGATSAISGNGQEIQSRTMQGSGSSVSLSSTGIVGNGGEFNSASVNQNAPSKDRNIGPKHIHKIMQLQNDAFMSITTSVAEIRYKVDQLRAEHIDGKAKQGRAKGENHPRDYYNPFMAADQREDRQRDIRQKLIDDRSQNDRDDIRQQAAPVGSAVPAVAAAPVNALGASGFATTFAMPPSPVKAPAPAANAFGAASAASATTPGFGIGSAAAPAAFGSTAAPPTTSGFDIGGAAAPAAFGSSAAPPTTSGFGTGGAPATSGSSFAFNVPK